MCKFFMPAGVAFVMASQIFFFSFYNNPYTGFIYLDMMGKHSYRPQSTEHNKQLNLFL